MKTSCTCPSSLYKYTLFVFMVHIDNLKRKWRVKVTHTIHLPAINIGFESVKDINRLTVTGHRPCQKQARSMTKYHSKIITYA